MKFVRRVPLKDQKRDEQGLKLCLVCESALPERRTSYCSRECWIRNTPQMIRAQVAKRDKGICAGCGRQCRLNSLRRSMEWEEFKKLPRWEADHITPVIEGGGLCGIDGYRTLCRDCHNKESASLAARRAAKRRGPLPPSLFDHAEARA